MRLSGTVTAFLTAILLVRFLTPVEQGYWYTFASILGIAGFAEMGAGQITPSHDATAKRNFLSLISNSSANASSR
jgi:hypothetical protein